MNSFNALCLVGLLSLGSAAWSQAAVAGDGVEEAVVKLEQQWIQAEMTNNPELSAPLFAETATFTGSSGTVRDKAAFLATEKATRYESAELVDLKVRAYGEAAIATYVFNAKGTESGKPFSLSERATDTWVKMPSGQWQLVASHSSAPKK